VTDYSHHFERIKEAHQRLDRHEGRIGALETNSAAEKVLVQNIEQSLSDIKGGITWITRLIIGAIILGAVGFALAGGFNVGP
jgi:hypothetical protein